MDRKLLEGIKSGVKAAKGSDLFEATEGRSARSVGIARDWLKGLKDIVANKADSLDVIRDTSKKIDAAVASGDLSDIYAQIKQQMPDTTDLGLIAANIASIEQWLNRDSTPPTKSESINEDRQDEFIGAVLKAGNEVIKGAANVVGGAAKAAGSVGTQAGNAVSNVAQTAGNAVKTGTNAANKGLQAVNNKMGTQLDKPAESYSVTNISKPPKVNASGDANDIKKTSVDYTDSDALDVTNSNPGTVADDVVEGYYADPEGYAFYVFEDGEAFYVDEEGQPVEEGYLGNIDTHEITGERLEEDTDEVYAGEIFENEEGDMVFFDESGELWYATEQDMYEAGYVQDEEGGWFIDEDVTININSDGTPVGNEPPPPPDALPPEAQGPAPEQAPEAQGDPNAQMPAQPVQGQGAPAADPNAPAQPMEVELVNNGQSGEVDRVIINANGKRIEIGPDGEPVIQPAGGAPAPQGQPPQESLISRAANVLNFFNECSVDGSKIRTAAGGTIEQTNVDYTDKSTLNAMNSGGDIDGKKRIKEGAGDYDHITIARGLGKSIRVPSGRMATDKFEERQFHAPVGRVDRNEGMVASGYKGKGGGIASDASTPNNLYKLQSSNWKGKDVSAKAVAKPDKNPEPGKKSESITNLSTFRRMSKGINEGYQAMADLAEEDGVVDNGN